MASPAVAQLTCGGIEATDLPAGYVEVAGAIAVVSPQTDWISPVEHPESGQRPGLFAKTGLLARPGVAARVEAGQASGAVWIGWGTQDGPAPVLDIPACPPRADQGGHAWIAYPGGFWVDEARCVTPEAGEPQSTQVPVGARCE